MPIDWISFGGASCRVLWLITKMFPCDEKYLIVKQNTYTNQAKSSFWCNLFSQRKMTKIILKSVIISLSSFVFFPFTNISLFAKCPFKSAAINRRHELLILGISEVYGHHHFVHSKRLRIKALNHWYTKYSKSSTHILLKPCVC